MERVFIRAVLLTFITISLIYYYKYYIRNYVKRIMVLDKYEYGYDGGYKVKLMYESNSTIAIAYLYDEQIFQKLEIGQKYAVKMRIIGDKIEIVSVL